MQEFCATPWPEDPTPISFKNCKDCGLYTHGTRMIWGEGNPTASLMILLDNPGARETSDGDEFVCGTRQTLQEAAHEAGLHQSDIYITYVLKRKPRKKYDKERTRSICIGHLKQQLIEKQPTLIFCLGNIAVQSFFQDPQAEVKNLRGEVHQINSFSTVVAYHPLAIRRRPNLRAAFMKDWKIVANELNKRK